MRTTLTLDEDVAGALNKLSHATRRSFKSTVNDVLRQGLMSSGKAAASAPPFTIKAEARGFRPGIDPLKLNQLADEFEEGRFLARSSCGTKAS